MKTALALAARGFAAISRSTVLSTAIALPLAAILFVGCKSEHAPDVKAALNSTGQGVTPAMDSTSQGKQVEVGKDHFIFLHPSPTTTQRFHVLMHRTITISIADSLFHGAQGKQAATNNTDLWLRQTVKSVKPDSSIDFTYRLDSVVAISQQDTMKLAYNSGNAANRKDPQFRDYNVLVGQEFGALVTKSGEISDIYGTNTIVNAILKDAPDSIKTRAKAGVEQQVKSILGEYVSRVHSHVPFKPMAKDSSWSATLERNFPVPPNVQFPVVIESKEKVQGFEDHGGSVLAHFEATTTITPKMSELSEGGAKAALRNFKAGVKSSTYVDDATGILVRRTVNEVRSYTFTLESDKQPGKMYSREENSREESLIELLR